MAQNPQPVFPFYIPASYILAIGWCINFQKFIGGLAGKYNVPASLLLQITDNADTLEKLLKYIETSEAFLKELIVAKDSLFTAYPPNLLPVQLPDLPVFEDLPKEVPAYVLAPFIEAAELVLRSPKRSEADVQLLRLVPAGTVPKPSSAKRREKAEDYNFPLMKIKFELGYVEIRFIRGNRFKGKNARLMVDREGRGIFQDVIITNEITYTEAAELPEGVQTQAWAYKAVYLDGNREVSLWSPAQTVTLEASPSPFGQAVPAVVNTPGGAVSAVEYSNGNGVTVAE